MNKLIAMFVFKIFFDFYESGICRNGIFQLHLPVERNNDYENSSNIC